MLMKTILILSLNLLFSLVVSAQIDFTKAEDKLYTTELDELQFANLKIADSAVSGISLSIDFHGLYLTSNLFYMRAEPKEVSIQDKIIQFYYYDARSYRGHYSLISTDPKACLGDLVEGIDVFYAIDRGVLSVFKENQTSEVKTSIPFHIDKAVTHSDNPVLIKHPVKRLLLYAVEKSDKVSADASSPNGYREVPVQAYPNPSSGTFTVKLDPAYALTYEQEVRLYDKAGQVHFAVNWKPGASYVKQISLPYVNFGIYYLKIAYVGSKFHSNKTLLIIDK